MVKKAFRCRSIPDNWEKEKEGIKPNHVMFTDDWDSARWDEYYYSEIILVENTKTEQVFKRKLTDKTTFRNLAIFSWKHDKSPVMG